MILGKNTKIQNATFLSSVDENPGFYADNILTPDSGELYAVTEGTVILTIDFDTITAQYLALFNVTIETGIQIELYDTGTAATIATYNYTTANLCGYISKNLLVDNTDEAATDFDRIIITSNGASSDFITSIGFLWAGDVLDFGCIETIQPSDNNADGVTISRANTPDAQKRYKFQSFQVKTRKEIPFLTIRSNIRTIFEEGIGTPRPMWFPYETAFFGDINLFYGILPVNKASYDPFYIKDNNSTFKSQITIELQEVQ